ncbi:MAG: hypothetical protein IJY11_03575 [Clostridia bacterium]|nr:hypothetical protein [Clostridia bacterium]
MKKKFLSFILAICLIIPCAFALTACGGGGSQPDLAGKTLTYVKKGTVDWSAGVVSYFQNDVGTTELNLEDFVEAVFEADNGIDFLEELCYYSNQEINSIEEAKIGLENFILYDLGNKNPALVFSADGTEMTAYDDTDYEFKTPLKTYSVQKDGENDYKIFDGQEQVSQLLVNSKDDIWCSGSVFTHSGVKKLSEVSGAENVTIKFPAIDGSSDYIDVSLSSVKLNYLVTGTLTYKVK